MIKFFHELTREEFKELIKTHITWGECAKQYPQPAWCDYSDAVCGEMGCWSLMDFQVINEDFCKTCDLYITR